MNIWKEGNSDEGAGSIRDEAPKVVLWREGQDYTSYNTVLQTLLF